MQPRGPRTMSDANLKDTVLEKYAQAALQHRVLEVRVAHRSGNLKDTVLEKYAQAALQVLQGTGRPACGGSTCADPISAELYDAAQTAGLPAQAVLASLGCGNPTALAELRAGETVLDLGSGGGIDVLLSARRVGPTGKAYGLDMTDEML